MATTAVKTLNTVLAVILTSSVVVAHAQQPPPRSASEEQDSLSTPPMGVVTANVATAQAVVESVDHAKRTATLRTEDGRTLAIEVPPSVVNFAQVEKGDKVKVTYEQATALFIRKPGEGTASGPKATTQNKLVRVAPRGAKPAGVMTQVTEITAIVEAIDYAKRRVTLRGPLGNERTVDVGDEVENLDRIKKGDEVVVRHTEAVAIDITK